MPRRPPVEWLSLPLDLALLRIAEGDWGDFCKGWGLREERGSPAAAAGRAADDAAEDGEEASAVATEGTAAGLARGRDGTGGRRKTADAICLTLSPTLPKLDENVTCVGFPQGGTQISVTRGVVSRIDVDAHYVLRIQIDAAINPGVRACVRARALLRCPRATRPPRVPARLASSVPLCAVCRV